METESFAPQKEFTDSCNIRTAKEFEAMYAESVTSPETFWPKIAENLHFWKPWNKVLDETSSPFYRWFVGGETNLSYNCLDRNVSEDADRVALVYEAENGENSVFTYKALLMHTVAFAKRLKELGVKKGDRVALYLPTCPESVAAMLAIVRIGAVHTVIFAGFSAEALRKRVIDSDAKLVITMDCSQRRGKLLPLLQTVAEALRGVKAVKVLVLKKETRFISENLRETNFSVDLETEQFDFTNSVCSDECIEGVDSEDPSFILYTSGTTGTPKGILHTTAGYMLGVYASSRFILDLRPGTVYWCTADIGWITGHSYVVYGPLLNGATVLLYDGAPEVPCTDRFWRIVQKHGVHVFYTAPTVVRTLMRWGVPDNADLPSLRLLGCVGEPLNSAAWRWFFDSFGGKRCPIVDTWWQTETGSIMLSCIPGIDRMKPGSVGKPFFGVDPVIQEDGALLLKRPWPSMARTIWKDSARFIETYWKSARNIYSSADAASKDEDGYFWIRGRTDDIIVVSGYNLSTAELESTANEHEQVAESAFVAAVHSLKGQGKVGFLVLKDGVDRNQEKRIKAEVNQLIVYKLGKFQLPELLVVVPELPKTRSGKIMRRLLRDYLGGKEGGDTSTLADPTVSEKLKSICAALPKL